MNIKQRLKAKETRFKIRKTYLGWLLFAISAALLAAGGIYYIQVMGG